MSHAHISCFLLTCSVDALDDHAGHDHDDDASIFIPFQWPQPTTRTFYKQSDPDWQEFVRMSNDEARVNSVRGM